MKTKNVKITLDNEETISAVIAEPDVLNSKSHIGLIFAHGAANDMNHPLIVSVSESLAESGFITLRFNFLYKERGKKAPDSQKVLVNTWLTVNEYMRNRAGYDISKIIPVGKSMGGRVASQIVADRLMVVDGLIFLGYPLHAPGKKDQLRDTHLYRIKVPMLFFAGSRDTLCDLDKLKGVLKNLMSNWELEVIEGGDHSFRLPKSVEHNELEVYQQFYRRTLNWLTQLT